MDDIDKLADRALATLRAMAEAAHTMDEIDKLADRTLATLRAMAEAAPMGVEEAAGRLCPCDGRATARVAPTGGAGRQPGTESGTPGAASPTEAGGMDGDLCETCGHSHPREGCDMDCDFYYAGVVEITADGYNVTQCEDYQPESGTGEDSSSPAAPQNDTGESGEDEA